MNTEKLLKIIREFKFPENERLNHCKVNLTNYINNHQHLIDQYDKETMSKEESTIKTYLKQQLQIFEENQKHIKKCRKEVVSLEIHTNAPELNKLHLTKNRIINTPHMTDIDSAIIKFIPKTK